MAYRLRAAFYVLMMLLVSAVVVGLYFDRPRDNPVNTDAPAAAADETGTPAPPQA